MKNLFKGILAHKILRHRQHRRFIHNLGATALGLGRGRSLLALGAIGLASAYLNKRRHARSNAAIPEYAQD